MESNKNIDYNEEANNGALNNDYSDEDNTNYTDLNCLNEAIVYNMQNGLELESLIAKVKRGSYIVPKFQRKFVWNKNQIANLILSLIKGIPIPPLYLYKEGEKTVILDGQQRVTAMFLYFNELFFETNNNIDRLDFVKTGVLLDKLKNSNSDDEKNTIYEDLKKICK